MRDFCTPDTVVPTLVVVCPSSYCEAADYTPYGVHHDP